MSSPESIHHDNYTSTRKTYDREIVAKALYSAIQDLSKQIPVEISIKAMQVKLETLILTDDYESRTRRFGHKVHVNGLEDRKGIWENFEWLFHLLDHGDFNDIAMQTIKIFYRLDAEVTDQQHYKQVRKHVAKLLEYSDWLEVMDHLKERNL